MHVTELQGWYCSCRFNYRQVGNETTGYDQIKEEMTEGIVIINCTVRNLCGDQGKNLTDRLTQHRLNPCGVADNLGQTERK